MESRSCGYSISFPPVSGHPGLAGLKDVDGFGELPGLPGAAAEFAQDAPGFERGVGAFTGAA